MRFICSCCGLDFAYEYVHEVEQGGFVCADCFIECEWEGA
jgi:hypothetical protein